jgi:hypothetical protein
MKRQRLLRPEYFCFLASIVFLILPVVPTVHWGGGFGLPTRFPALTACWYYLVAGWLVLLTGYCSVVGLLKDRRSAHRAFVRKRFHLSVAESSTKRLGAVQGGKGWNLIEVKIEQPHRALDVQLDLALTFEGMAKSRKARLLVDPSDDYRMWRTVVRENCEWTAYLDVAIAGTFDSAIELVLSVTCFYSQRARIS